MTRCVGVHEAKTHLSRLIADVEAGAEVEITRRGVVVARLVAPRSAPRPRQFGVDVGLWVVPDDFDAPLPDDLMAGFTGDALQQ